MRNNNHLLLFDLNKVIELIRVVDLHKKKLCFYLVLDLLQLFKNSCSYLPWTYSLLRKDFGVENNFNVAVLFSVLSDFKQHHCVQRLLAFLNENFTREEEHLLLAKRFEEIFGMTLFDDLFLLLNFVKVVDERELEEMTHLHFVD
jgi:hypothetical protein